MYTGKDANIEVCTEELRPLLKDKTVPFTSILFRALAGLLFVNDFDLFTFIFF